MGNIAEKVAEMASASRGGFLAVFCQPNLQPPFSQTPFLSLKNNVMQLADAVADTGWLMASGFWLADGCVFRHPIPATRPAKEKREV